MPVKRPTAIAIPRTLVAVFIEISFNRQARNCDESQKYRENIPGGYYPY
jgi:hypothetical protein